MNTITATFEVTDQLCADILCTVIDSGAVNYFAAGTSRPKRTDKGEYESVILVDDEDEDAEKPFTLDYAAIRLGLQRILSGECKVRRDLVGYALGAVISDDAGDVDTDVADVIVQAAWFGELVYG